jgi:DNA-binding transcriptional LysR family regulator
MTQHTCRALGAFDPDVRHRANDATVGLALVAGGHAVTLLPDLALAGRDEGVVTRAIAEGPVTRRILAATRSADAARPSTRALLHAIRGAAGALVERAPAVVRAPRARRSAAGGP